MKIPFGIGLRVFTNSPLLVLFGAAFLFGLSPVQGLRGADPPAKLTAPQLFPDKTLAYFRIDDVRRLRQDYQGSGLGKMSNDPKLKPFVDEFYGAMIRVTEEAFGQIGMNLDEFLSIPSGELAFALLAAPKGARSPTARRPAARSSLDEPEDEAAAERPQMIPPIFAMMVDAGDDISGIQVMLQRMGGSRAGESEHLQKNFHRLTLHNFQSREDEQRQFAYFIDQGVLIAATNAKILEDLALVWLGQAANRRTLAQNHRFLAMMKRCVGTEGERPQVSFYADPMGMLRAMSPGDPMSMMMMAMLPPLGLDGFEAIGGSWIVAPADFDSIGHIHALLANPRQAVLSLLKPKPGSTQPEKWVPANVATYATLNWDLQSALVGVERLYNQFRGEDAMNREVFLPAKEQTGIDFREDFVAQMEGRITFLQGYVRPITADSQSNVIAIRMKNVKRFERDVMPELIRWMGTQARAETAQFGSIRAHVFRAGRQRLPEESQMASREQESCIAILDDYLLLSDSSYMFQQIADALKDPSNSLSESLEFQLIHDRIKAHLHGKQAAAITYARPEEQIQNFYELIRDPQDRMGLEQLDIARRANSRRPRSNPESTGDETRSRLARSNPFYQALNEALEKQELPPLAEITKHMAPRGGFLVEEDTGLHYTFFSLRRE